MMPRISIKRVYDAPAASDGYRVLAERLWPRGLKKKSLKLDGWLREVAPSSALRKWFSHDPAKWTEFQRRYEEELRTNPEAWADLFQLAHDEPVTLLFSSRDETHNNVAALRTFLLAQREKYSTRRRRQPTVSGAT
jgi:uncharacterized protein YeaO (DUF488 family)